VIGSFAALGIKQAHDVAPRLVLLRAARPEVRPESSLQLGNGFQVGPGLACQNTQQSRVGDIRRLGDRTDAARTHCRSEVDGKPSRYLTDRVLRNHVRPRGRGERCRFSARSPSHEAQASCAAESKRVAPRPYHELVVSITV
jgi:hypothetical protein